MTTKKSVVRRLAAGVGALALATAGTLAMGTAASAAVGDPAPGQDGAPTEGTLTINKYSGGHTENPAAENLLDGVEFTVTQVGRMVVPPGGGDAVCTAVDLADTDDWAGLEGLFDTAPTAPSAPFCLLTGSAVEGVTGEGGNPSGQVVFNLNVGVYYVQETNAGGHPIVSPVPNFYVSIPTSLGEDGAGWNYDVVADPKNQLSEAPTKTVEEFPDGLVVGYEVTWEMSVPIPTLNNDELFTSAVITDALDDRLTLVANSSVVRIDGAGPSDALTEGTHFTVAVGADNVVTWTFNADGLAILDRYMGSDLLIDFDNTVISVGDGSIPNDDYKSDFNGTEVPGEDEPHVYVGELTIKKVDDSADVLPLEGASFAVYEAEYVESSDTYVCAATAPATGVLATGTSNADGVVVWDTDPESTALGLSILTSDEPLTPLPTKGYCVYETATPAGHTMQDFENLVMIDVGENGTEFDMEIVNARIEGPDLPLTGAQGTMVMTLGGLLLVGAGTGAIVVSRRNRNHVEA